ncbi:MAG: hypothetical protein V2A54_06240 [Bacteroidota bacterium]
MKSILYIELKTGYDDNGPAWITKGNYSKSGKIIYFNGKAFKSSGGAGNLGNYLDIKTNDEYWISGAKKNGEDRLKPAAGKIKMDQNVLKKYLEFTGHTELNKEKFEVVEIKKTDKTKFSSIENKKKIV